MPGLHFTLKVGVGASAIRQIQRGEQEIKFTGNENLLNIKLVVYLEKKGKM